MASDTRPPSKAREKIAIKPGFHLADWMRLTTAASDLSGRNGGPPRKITMSELASHCTQFDCWTAYNGRVYNITNYLPYHPGGVPKLMLGAGKDCTALFNRYHAWVNGDSMLAKCYIGTLIPDPVSIPEGDEEEADDDVVGKATADAGKATGLGDTLASDSTGEPEAGSRLDDVTVLTQTLERARALLEKDDDDDDDDGNVGAKPLGK
jgi:cytochrome b involved in lipid metabolism